MCIVFFRCKSLYLFEASLQGALDALEMGMVGFLIARAVQATTLPVAETLAERLQCI